MKERNQEADYRSALIDVGSELTEDDATNLAFEIPAITRGERSKITSGEKLVQALKPKKFITADDVDPFIALLEKRELNEAADILKKYKKEYIVEDERTVVHPSDEDEDESDPLTVKKESAREKTVAVKDLQHLASKITRQWKDVGRLLGVEEEDLDTLEDNHRGKVQESSIQMLRHWKERKGIGATYRVLGKALEEAGRKDLQEEVYKRA